MAIKILVNPLSEEMPESGPITREFDSKLISPKLERLLQGMSLIPYPQSTHSGELHKRTKKTPQKSNEA
jgi:hypothetical protein